MSLKNVANSRIYKRRQEWRNYFLNGKSQLKNLQTNNKSSNDVEVKTSEKRRKCRYKKLEFSESGSSKGSNMYVNELKSDQQKKEITIIPETDTEGEGQGKEETPLKKMKTMPECFQPKMKLTDTIVLHSDESDSG